LGDFIQPFGCTTTRSPPLGMATAEISISPSASASGWVTTTVVRVGGSFGQ
jgi:hypothetical protein